MGMTTLRGMVLPMLTVAVLLLIPLWIIGGAWRAHRMGCASPAGGSISGQLLPKSAEVVRFVAPGDTGSGNTRQAAVAQALAKVCRAEGCDFVAMLGDMVYPGGIDSADDADFQRLVMAPYGGLKIPLVPVMGNHDIRGDATAMLSESRRYGTWVMPHFHWTFQAGPAAFHAINTNCPVQDLPQLAEDLPAAVDAPARPWQFVLAHHPIYTVGHHGDAPPLTRWYWDRAIQGRVDFYLSGHSHDLEHLHNSGDGTEFLISGGGGQPRMEPVAEEPSAADADFRNRGSGFLWVELRPAQVTYRYYDTLGGVLHEGTRRRGT